MHVAVVALLEEEHRRGCAARIEAFYFLIQLLERGDHGGVEQRVESVARLFHQTCGVVAERAARLLLEERLRDLRHELRDAVARRELTPVPVVQLHDGVEQTGDGAGHARAVLVLARRPLRHPEAAAGEDRWTRFAREGNGGWGRGGERGKARARWKKRGRARRARRCRKTRASRRATPRSVVSATPHARISDPARSPRERSWHKRVAHLGRRAVGARTNSTYLATSGPRPSRDPL